MASLPFLATIVPPSVAFSGGDLNIRDGYVFGKAIFSRKLAKKRELSIMNVATKAPVVAPVVAPPPRREVTVGDDRRKLAAWTSIRQERWEGELVVEGEIPLWLVC